ncbi:tail fiber domain-containing protein [bacterium]|nr:tail fiber domain-containing protein [bacterium]
MSKKTWFAVGLLLLSVGLCFAQIPRIISYQGYLTNTDEEPVSDGTYSITFRLFNSETGGYTLWNETQDVEVANGLYSVYLGSISGFSLDFDQSYWLEVEFDGTTLSPRYKLAAAPYALNAVNAGTAITAAEVAWSDITGMPAAIADGDDYMYGETATGDLAGTYPNPSVSALQGVDISSSSPTSGQVLKFDGSAWSPGTDLTGGASGTLNDLTDVSAPSPSVGEVIKWNGSVWANAPDDAGGGSVGSLSEVLAVGNSAGINDINMNSNALLNIDWASSDDGSSSLLDADFLDGMDGSYYLDWDNFTDVPVDLVDGDDYMDGEAAGGDLAGTYPDPIVDALQGVVVSSTSPTTGQVLKFDGSEWTPGPDETGGAGAGLWTDNTNYISPNDNEKVWVYDLNQQYGIYVDVDDTDEPNIRHGIYVFRDDDGFPYRPGTGFRNNEALANIAAYDLDAGEYNFAIGGWSYLDSSNTAGVFGGNYNGTTFGALASRMNGHIYAGYFQGNVHVDGITSIGNVTDERVNLEVNGTQHIFFDNDGIVNIGNTDEWHLSLDNNEVHARFGTEPSELFLNDFGGYVRIASTATFYYDSIALFNNNVGIGAVDPFAFLEIEGNSYTNYPHIKLEETDPTDYARLNFANDAEPGRFFSIAGITASDSDFSELNFYYQHSPTTFGNIMQITGDGKVGIGTVRAPAVFAVNYAGGGGDPGILLTSPGLTCMDWQSTAASGETWRWESSIDGAFKLWKVEAEFALEVTPGLDMGIGTGTPAGKLHVHKDGTWPDLLIVSGYDVTNALRLGSGVTWASIGCKTDTNAIVIKHSDGRVGIKRTTPSYDLHLQNDSAAKPSTNTWTVASDRRLKTDIEPFTDGLDKLLAIEPVWYNYNGIANMPTDTRNIGVIAQDIQKVCPYTVGSFEAILNPDNTGQTVPQIEEYLDFNSHALTFVAINAIKELNQKIEELEAEIESLKAQVEK